MAKQIITAQIIKAMSALKYSPDEEGVCYGIAMMAIQAQVRGDFDAFLNRMRFIERFNFDTPAGRSQFENAVADPENAHFYVKPFFEELCLYFGSTAMGNFAYPERSIVDGVSQKMGLYAEQGPTLAGLNLGGDTDKPYLSSMVGVRCAGNTNLTQDLDQYFTTHSDDVAFEVAIPSTHSMAVIGQNDSYYLIDHDFIYRCASQGDLVQCLFKILRENFSEHQEIDINSWCNAHQYHSRVITPSADAVPGYPQSITQNMYRAVKNRDFGGLHDLLMVENSIKKTDDQRQVFNRGCSKLLEEAAHLDDLEPLIKCFKAHDVQLEPVRLKGVESDFLVKTSLALGGSSTEQGEGKTLLRRVIESGHVEALRQLIAECGANVEAVDSQGFTALHWAALGGHVDIVRMLVKESKVNVEAADSDSLTALHRAVILGYTEIVKTLVNECRANVEAVDSKGVTALHRAVILGHAEIAKTLVNECRANVEAVDSKGVTALHCAALTGDVETVRMLVNECDAAVEALDSDGKTALHWAAIVGHVDIVDMLANACKKSLYATDSDDGRAVLHLAALWGRADIVRMLVNKHRVDVNLTGAEYFAGMTALHMLAVSGENAEIVKVLIKECGADVDVLNVGGQTALHVAASRGHVDIARALVNAGGVLNAEMAQLLQGKKPDAFKVFLRDQCPHRLGLKAFFAVTVTCAAWGVFAASSLSLIANMSMMPVWIPILISVVACSSIAMSWSNRDRLFREIKAGNVNDTDNVLQKYSQPKALQLVQGLLGLSMVALCMMVPFTLMGMAVPSTVMAIAISSVAALCTVGAACAVYLKGSVASDVSIGDGEPNVALTTSRALASVSKSNAFEDSSGLHSPNSPAQEDARSSFGC